MKSIIKICFIMALGANIHALAGEVGTALKADTLRAEPFADAKAIGSLNKNDSVEILSKKGAWLQVKSKKSTGWVRLLSVKRGGASSSGSDLSDIASGRTGTGKVVSTTGIRGLNEEELKTAKFNEEEMKKMESYAATASQAKSFASAGGLSATQLAYFKGAKK
jgi:hypothetical protein